MQDRVALFPNSNFYVNGGCILSNEHFIRQTTYCEECRDVHQKWCQTHQTQEGLALDHEAYDFIIRYQIGLSSSIIINTSDIDQPLESTSLSNAIKILQIKNPSIAITDLKKYLLYLQKKKEIFEKISFSYLTHE